MDTNFIYNQIVWNKTSNCFYRVDDEDYSDTQIKAEKLSTKNISSLGKSTTFSITETPGFGLGSACKIMQTGNSNWPVGKIVYINEWPLNPIQLNVEVIDSEGNAINMPFGYLTYKPNEEIEAHLFYTQIPTNVKAGDKFELIRYKSWDGQEVAREYKLGSIWTLTENFDNSEWPYFMNEIGDDRSPIRWGCLRPVKSNPNISGLSFSSIPKNVSLGDKFKVVSKTRFDGSLESNTVKIGEIVSLIKEDGTERPKFKYEKEGLETYLSWGCLTFLEEQTEVKVMSKEGFKSKPTNVSVGDQFVVIDIGNGQSFTPINYRLKKGDIITLSFNDDSSSPRFRKGDNPSIYVDWRYLTPYEADNQIFKEGDTVQVTNLETTHRGGGNWTDHIGYLGKTCVLTKLNAKELNKNHEVTILADLSGVNWHRSMLKIISSNSDFQVGDTVEYIGDKSLRSGFKNDIDIITSISPCGEYLRFQDSDSGEKKSWFKKFNNNILNNNNNVNKESNNSTSNNNIRSIDICSTEEYVSRTAQVSRGQVYHQPTVPEIWL